MLSNRNHYQQSLSGQTGKETVKTLHCIQVKLGQLHLTIDNKCHWTQNKGTNTNILRKIVALKVRRQNDVISTDK